MDEKTIWQGTPSQWTNFKFYLLCCVLIVPFGFGLPLAIWKYLDTKLNVIKITNQRIIETRGIVSKITTEAELSSIQDIQFRKETWYLNFFRLSNIVIITTDYNTPVLIIKGIENGENLKEKIKLAASIQKQLKNNKLIN